MTMSDIDPKPPGPQEAPTLNLDKLDIMKGMIEKLSEATKGLGSRLDQHADDTKRAVEGIAQTMLDNHSSTARQLADLDRRMTVQEAWKVAQEGRADAASLRVASLTDELSKEQKAREALAELAAKTAAETNTQTTMIRETRDFIVNNPRVKKVAIALFYLVMGAITTYAASKGISLK